MMKLIIILRPVSRYLLISWGLTIIILSSIPNIPTLKIHIEKAEFRLDYLMHFCEYGILTFVTFLSFAGEEFKIRFRKFMLITAFLVTFAALDELHQKFIPGRTCSINDVASDVTGVLAAIIFTLLVFRSIGIRSKKRE